MMLRSKPVRFLITRVARAYGFLDPVALLASLRGFAKPSEVAEPIELLRAGMLFHARGLINTKAIQNNLDWVWPYWVERQFNPGDPSFIPRAFSFSHINLTHRNWTAVGLPDVPFYPIVDPRGLVTPQFDGWSLDFWHVSAAGAALLPSKIRAFDQELAFVHENAGGRALQLEVRSVAHDHGVTLETRVTLVLDHDEPHCRIRVRLAGAAPGGAIAVALRPYNPEGVSFIKQIDVASDRAGWLVNRQHPIRFDRAPARHLLSTYQAGDVLLRLGENLAANQVECPVSMATAVGLFPVADSAPVACEVRVPIYDELEPKHRPVCRGTESWVDALAPLARLAVPDAAVQRLYELALASVVLHTPADVYPGPYTYKRFWFRDAVFILNALLSLGGIERTRRALHGFAPRQRLDGYFLSQEGEWDSNGEALWFYHRFAALAGEPPPKDWRHAVAKGARWIHRKRLAANLGTPEAGLLPAGFSAEHLGPNDYYYWDDFWAVAGLRAAADLLRTEQPDTAARHASEAAEFLATIRRSFPAGPHRRFPGAIPASLHRRMDSGAIGSLVADYPLQLFPAGDPWIRKTTDYLCANHLQAGGFFQDMIHSGINAYLTLHLAQVRLRAGDTPAAWELMDRVMALASPTGQWPEAIHPRTFGGCMGDGQHIWAAAEWLMLVRHLFVREEGNALVIGAGIRPEWWRDGEASFGPTLTPHGKVSVRVASESGGVRLRLDARWRDGAGPRLELRLPGCVPVPVAAGDCRAEYLLSPPP